MPGRAPISQGVADRCGRGGARTMATLTVWKFDEATGAGRALQMLERQQKAELIEIVDAAIVTWPEGRKKPKTQQLHNMTGAGALGGSFWGLLFGLLFFIPLLGMAVGAAMGALSGSMADVGSRHLHQERAGRGDARILGALRDDRAGSRRSGPGGVPHHRRETGVDEPVDGTGSPLAGGVLRDHRNTREGLIPVRTSGPALLGRRRTRMWLGIAAGRSSPWVTATPPQPVRSYRPDSPSTDGMPRFAPGDPCRQPHEGERKIDGNARYIRTGCAGTALQSVGDGLRPVRGRLDDHRRAVGDHSRDFRDPE